ncbi:ABC transporter permease [Chitinophaga sp.]|uniref:ABC transporter permease n=1 Tax=Chitinophaga sp. TaxID=1869181 RepID=UPI0031DE7119
MLKHYFRVALRHLRRQQVITVINILGLAIGMACCMLIVLFVRNEYGFDNFHPNGNNIYRVTNSFTKAGETNYGSNTQWPVAPYLKNEISDIKASVRIMNMGTALYTFQDKQYVDPVAYADAGFFTLFNFPLVKGNAATALQDPYTMVVTEKIAKKYFGNNDPIGKILKVDNQFDCRITAVAKDLPLNTDIGKDIVLSYATFEQLVKKDGSSMEQWYNFNDNTTFIQLADGVSLHKMETQLQGFTDRHVKAIASSLGEVFGLDLQPLANIHLHPYGDKNKQDNAYLLYIYIVIAIVIILIACFNFMNLITARANERAIEVGVRKVMGSERRQLVIQFMSEAVLLTTISFVLAILLALLFMPWFDKITGKEFELFTWSNLPFLGYLFAMSIVVGLLSGSYPALYLSGFLPVAVLKGGFKTAGSRVWIRKTLVIAQFSIAIILIVATIVVYSQLRYWQNKYLGFDKERLVTVNISSESAKKAAKVIKEELLRQQGIQQVTMSNTAMGRYVGAVNPVVKEGDSEDKSIVTSVIIGDFDLLKTLDIKLTKGRDFSTGFATDSNNSFIVNEAMVKAMNMHDPIGQRIKWLPGFTERKGEIIGVAKDFNYSTLTNPVSPAIYIVQDGGFSVMSIRLSKGGDLTKQVADIEKVWKKYVTDYPLSYSFVADDLARQYINQDRLASLFGTFSMLAIVIACMGLFGLSILIARQRTKEIGIRKVLGASTTNITRLLSQDFMQLVLIALLIAVPVSWYLMNQWLQDFAYRIDVEWWMFVIAGFMAMIIALFTISFQSVKAALNNPIKSLRTE